MVVYKTEKKDSFFSRIKESLKEERFLESNYKEILNILNIPKKGVVTPNSIEEYIEKNKNNEWTYRELLYLIKNYPDSLSDEVKENMEYYLDMAINHSLDVNNLGTNKKRIYNDHILQIILDKKFPYKYKIKAAEKYLFYAVKYIKERDNSISDALLIEIKEEIISNKELPEEIRNYGLFAILDLYSFYKYNKHRSYIVENVVGTIQEIVCNPSYPLIGRSIIGKAQIKEIWEQSKKQRKELEEQTELFRLWKEDTLPIDVRVFLSNLFIYSYHKKEDIDKIIDIVKNENYSFFPIIEYIYITKILKKRKGEALNHSIPKESRKNALYVLLEDRVKKGRNKEILEMYFKWDIPKYLKKEIEEILIAPYDKVEEKINHKIKRFVSELLFYPNIRELANNIKFEKDGVYINIKEWKEAFPEEI